MKNLDLAEVKNEASVLEIERLNNQQKNFEGILTINVNYYSQLITGIAFGGIPFLKEEFKEYVKKTILKNYKNKIINFRITIISEKNSREKEKQIELAINKFVDETIEANKLELNKSIKKIVYSLIIGTIFMYCLFNGERLLSKSIKNSMLIEGIKVGGWMYMWQAFQTLGFDVLEIKKEINILKRFKSLKKKFRYY